MAKKTTARKAVKAKKMHKADKSAHTGRTPSPAKPASGKQPPSKERVVHKSPLNKMQLDEFRKLLMEKRRALVGDMNGIRDEAMSAGQQNKNGAAMPTHPADIGTDNYEQEFTLGLLESERTLLTEIEEALERITKGTYGLCIATGKPINVARLRARPWAKFCIEYARQLERGLISKSADNASFEDSDDEDIDDDDHDDDSADAGDASEVEEPAADEEVEAEEPEPVEDE